ncbi:MAG: hypothetical protein AABW88_02235 [Nanoarchaeota archaeon]
MKIKYFGTIISVLLLLYAFDIFIFGIMTPVFEPALNTLTDKIMRALLSIILAAGILVYMSKIEN